MYGVSGSPRALGHVQIGAAANPTLNISEEPDLEGNEGELQTGEAGQAGTSRGQMAVTYGVCS